MVVNNWWFIHAPGIVEFTGPSLVVVAVVVGDPEPGLARVHAVDGGLVNCQDAVPSQRHLRGQLLILLRKRVQQRKPQRRLRVVLQTLARAGQLKV